MEDNLHITLSVFFRFANILFANNCSCLIASCLLFSSDLIFPQSFRSEDFADVKEGDILEIYHEEENFSRLLLQVGIHFTSSQFHESFLIGRLTQSQVNENKVVS